MLEFVWKERGKLRRTPVMIASDLQEIRLGNFSNTNVTSYLCDGIFGGKALFIRKKVLYFPQLGEFLT